MGLGGEMPLAVVTVTATAPGSESWGGLTAVIWVSESTVKLVAGTVPKVTALAPVNPDPLKTTVVAPEMGPLPGLTPVTSGAAGSVGPILAMNRFRSSTLPLP